jgi:hypothetical protein
VTEETEGETEVETEGETEEKGNPYLERAEEILRFIDDSTQTFVLLFMDYNAGEFEIASNANSAEEVLGLMLEGIEEVKEDCLEENLPEWPIDKRFH